ncbi:EF-hand domain-containing protein [Rhodoplanes sp.]|uniref:EF-hand domain-containing protein n=1 Tax=Rhodoplanes sp. TaxID=1968906 RepID=UPI00345C59B8
MFSSIDTDGDGSISKSEMESLATSSGGTTDQADSVVSSLDSDSDGSVSQAELAKSLKSMFDTLASSMFSGSNEQRSVSITA